MHIKYFNNPADLVNLVLILLLTTCSWLYNSYILQSTGQPLSIEVSKRDFIAFPIKETESKIYPVTKELLSEKSIQVSSLTTALRIGSRDDIVEYIQRRLIVYGYTVDADGLYSAITYDAILNFQYRCGLDFDGEVGTSTLEKLNIPPNANTKYNTKVASLTNSNNSTSNIGLNNYKSITKLESSMNSSKVTSETNYYINVDLLNQRVNIFIKSNEKWVLDKSFLCASGAPGTPTVRSNFTVQDKGPMFRAGSNTICAYYTRISGNYLFHTVLLDNNNNIKDGRLGSPLSHGCLRLAIDDAKYIYTTIPFGTNIYIH
ncbi:MAG TPA: L,D-transpeptidase family protein [Clostridium sp.]